MSILKLFQDYFEKRDARKSQKALLKVFSAPRPEKYTRYIDNLIGSGMTPEECHLAVKNWYDLLRKKYSYTQLRGLLRFIVNRGTWSFEMTHILSTKHTKKDLFWHVMSVFEVDAVKALLASDQDLFLFLADSSSEEAQDCVRWRLGNLKTIREGLRGK